MRRKGQAKTKSFRLRAADDFVYDGCNRGYRGQQIEWLTSLKGLSRKPLLRPLTYLA